MGYWTAASDRFGAALGGPRPGDPLTGVWQDFAGYLKTQTDNGHWNQFGLKYDGLRR